MASYVALWSRVIEASRFYRRLASRYDSKYKATILNLAASALEDLGDDIANGFIRRSTEEKIEYVVKLLRSNYLPHYTIEKIYREALKALPKQSSLVIWSYPGDDLGVVGL